MAMWHILASKFCNCCRFRIFWLTGRGAARLRNALGAGVSCSGGVAEPPRDHIVLRPANAKGRAGEGEVGAAVGDGAARFRLQKATSSLSENRQCLQDSERARQGEVGQL